MQAMPFPAKTREVTKTETKATWNDIDPQSLPEDLARHYYAFRKAEAAAREAWKLFTSEANEAFDAGPGNKLAFGNNYGKLSVAIVPASAPTSRNAVALSSLVKSK